MTATDWQRIGENEYEGRDRVTDKTKWIATAVHLVSGSNSQLRALAPRRSMQRDEHRPSWARTKRQ